MLKSMKGVKMSGLTPLLEKTIQGLRSKEISAAFKFRIFTVAATVAGEFAYSLPSSTPASRRNADSVTPQAFLPQALAPVLSFCVTIATDPQGRALAAGQLFTSLLLIRLLTQPLTMRFMATPLLMSSIVCVNRIQNFVQSNTNVDYRSSPEPATFAELIDAEKRSPPGSASGSSCTLTSRSTSIALSVRDANFGWSKDSEPLLKAIDFQVERGSLVMIIGPAGAGKSTLLRALLGETVLFQGGVFVSDRRMAYCEQTPWLPNGTIQECILGQSLWDQGRYDATIRACVLEEDFDVLPDQDKTVIGSNGAKLSGGQRQRIVSRRL